MSVPGGTSVSRIQSSTPSAGGRLFGAVVVVRLRLAENHSQTPCGAPTSCASPISGPTSPDSERSVLRARFASCFAFARSWRRLRSKP